jgi:hypothetical protein
MTNQNDETRQGETPENQPDEPWHHKHLPALLAGWMFALLAFFILLSLFTSN